MDSDGGLNPKPPPANKPSVSPKNRTQRLGRNLEKVIMTQSRCITGLALWTTRRWRWRRPAGQPRPDLGREVLLWAKHNDRVVHTMGYSWTKR